MCSGGNRGHKTSVDKQSSQCSYPGETLPPHKRSGWGVFPSSAPSAIWDVLVFWCLFWCSSFFFCSYVLHVFGWRWASMKRGQEIWGLKKKANTWSHFLEFSCLWNFKINEKIHDFQELGLPFPPRPLNTHTHTHTHTQTHNRPLADSH